MSVCLRCNHKNDDEALLCVNCDADMYISLKTRNIAVKLYNRGLFLARERKLQEAASVINKSIYFDRFNIEARNVLGLVYFELGMIADALKQWAISASYYGEKNPATIYLSRIKDNVREMERMNDAVKMYNQGLVNLKNKNDDMAVIQLKKAIELNPKLIEAKNLLAVAYMSAGNNQAAIPLIDSVRSYDITNDKAISLKESLGPSPMVVQRYSRPPAKYENPAKTDPYIQKKVKRFGGFPLSEVLCVLIGAACAAAAIYILVIPSIESGGKEDVERQLGIIESMKQSHEKALADKNAEIEALTKRNEELQNENFEIENRTLILEKQQKIMTAVSLSAAGSIRESAAIIKDLDLSGLSDSDISQYNSVKETVFPQMASTLFEEGRVAYNAQSFDEAKNAFLTGLEYGMTESNAGDAYYYLGRIAENDNDLPSARLNYEKTVNEFSACTQLNNATNRLRALE